MSLGLNLLIGPWLQEQTLRSTLEQTCPVTSLNVYTHTHTACTHIHEHRLPLHAPTHIHRYTAHMFTPTHAHRHTLTHSLTYAHTSANGPRCQGSAGPHPQDCQLKARPPTPLSRPGRLPSRGRRGPDGTSEAGKLERSGDLGREGNRQ